jgi:hypothetical protein
MNRQKEPFHDESDRALDRAIRAVLTNPAPEEVKNRVIQAALGFAESDPGVSRDHFLERVVNMFQSHKRLSVAAAVAALAAGLALSIFLVSPSGQAYALEEILQANNHVTIYHVKITPAAELGEAWVQLNPDGTPLQARMEFQSPEDGAKVVILSNGKAEVWFKDKKSLVFVPLADALKRISDMRNLADPKLAFERLQAAKAAGKVQVETKQPAKDTEPIVLTVTSADRREVYEVNSQAKLVERITSYRRKGEKWAQVALYQFLDYNKPIDPKVFQPEIPKDVTVVDQINRKPGLVKGDLTDEEIATKVVREFFDALITRDYDKAGVIYEAVPAQKVKEGLGQAKFIRIVEIGKPRPGPNPRMKALQVPVKVEIEVKGRREVQDFSPLVRPVEEQPDRWDICGGI